MNSIRSVLMNISMAALTALLLLVSVPAIPVQGTSENRCGGVVNALSHIPPDSPGYDRVVQVAEDGDCEQALELVALTALYNSTGGPTWNGDTSWLDPHVPYCDWAGVFCENGRVAHIGLYDKGLSGPIPSEVKYLTALISFNVGKNGVISLPIEIFQLEQLRGIYVNANQIVSLPDGDYTAPSLYELNLAGNLIETLPNDIGGLDGLVKLTLGFNPLTSLPGAIGELSNLEALHITSTSLETLPVEFGELDKLMTLYLSDNRLHLADPETRTALGGLTQLDWLYLNKNDITEIPSEFGMLANLRTLNMEENQISSISPDIQLMTSLETLDLSNNVLVQLPPEMSVLSTQKLTRLEVDGNPDLCVSFYWAANIDQYIGPTTGNCWSCPCWYPGSLDQLFSELQFAFTFDQASENCASYPLGRNVFGTASGNRYFELWAYDLADDVFECAMYYEPPAFISLFGWSWPSVSYQIDENTYQICSDELAQSQIYRSAPLNNTCVP